MMSQPVYIISMRSAGAPCVIPGSIQSRCSQCQSLINVTPSGQRSLRQIKNAVSLCYVCYQALQNKITFYPEDARRETEAALASLRKEAN